MPECEVKLFVDMKNPNQQILYRKIAFRSVHTNVSH